jgi:hypothetical protein
MQGYFEMAGTPQWNGKRRILSGISQTIAGETYEMVLANNGFPPLNATAAPGSALIQEMPGNPNLSVLRLRTAQNANVSWKIAYGSPKSDQVSPPHPQSDGLDQTLYDHN